MKNIRVYDEDSERINKISEKYNLYEAEIIEMILDYIEDEKAEAEIFWTVSHFSVALLLSITLISTPLISLYSHFYIFLEEIYT